MNLPSITLKSSIVILSILIIVVLSVSMLILQKRFNNEISSTFESETVELLRSLNSSFVFPVSVGDNRSVDAIATNVVENRYIYSLEIRASSGEVITSKVNSSLETQNEIQVIPYSIPITDPRFVTLSPFDQESDGNESVGTIKVLLTRNRMNQMLSTMMRDNIIIVLVCIAIVLMMIYALGKIIARNFALASSTLESIGTDRFVSNNHISIIEEFNELNSHLNVIGDKVSRALIELRKSDDFKRNMIAMISHDLRTPVNTIAPLVEIMLEIIKVESPHSIVREHLEICRDSTKLLRSILDQLLEFREIDQTEMVINRSQFNTETMFDSLFNMFKSKVKKGVAFNVVGEANDSVLVESLVTVSDEGKILRLLSNLIDNAIKYTEEGSINVNWKIDNVDDRYALKVTVKDTGSGIEAEHIPYIFDQYFRGNESNPGWGVGLSVVKQFINLLQGDIKVVSKIYEGTTIRVSIPVTIIENKHIASYKSLGCSVLVVDDNHHNCYVMQHVLDRMGVKSRIFTNPEEALSSIEQLNIDAVFVDYAMPEMTGIEFGKRLRQKGINMPVVCITAHIEDEILNEINHSINRDEGVTHLLMKPINISKIQDTLISIVDASVIVSAAIENISKD